MIIGIQLLVLFAITLFRTFRVAPPPPLFPERGLLRWVLIVLLKEPGSGAQPGRFPQHPPLPRFPREAKQSKAMESEAKRSEVSFA